MMEFLTWVYLIYTFVAFYFLLIYMLTYLQNKKYIHEYIAPDKIRTLSIVIPCYNEEENIGQTIEHHLQSDYSGLKKIIVVDDCSTDKSYEIIKKYAKKYPKVLAVQTPENTGRAAGAKNYGAKFVKTELIGFSDADSFPEKHAIYRMMGFFNDPKMGAVTSRVLVKNLNKPLTKIQAIEYKVIAFTRKLLGFLDSIYVTNGPLSIYRKSAFDQVHGFDMKNLTEDIEITWHFVSKGWKVQMAIPSKVYSVVPSTIKAWFHQRIRWNVGGMQTIAKYRKKFFQCGMLGLFIMPFFILSWFLGISGMFFLAYRLTRYVVVRLLIARYSVSANVAVLRMEDLALNPSILLFFGLLLFALGFIYTLIALNLSREEGRPKGRSVLDIFLYSMFYLLMYPPLLIISFYKYFRGYNKW